jgi:phenylacetate-CoA ligase
MYVEILDSAGQPVAPSERGEVTLTGGFNFCLPLLRYRTGDFASLEFVRGEPVLRDLEGRAFVRFQRPDGVWLNNIDVTHVLRPLTLSRFSLHQRADSTFEFSVEGPDAAIDEAHDALSRLFGPAARIESTPFKIGSSDKTLQYSSALAGSDS